LEKLACGRFSDISCVSASKRRDFCRLRSAGCRRLGKYDKLLVEIAILDSAELIGHERGPSIGTEQAKRSESLKRTIGALDPFAGLALVAKRLDSALCDSRDTRDAVALLDAEHALLFAALGGALIGLDDPHEPRRGLTQELAEMLNGCVLESEGSGQANFFPSSGSLLSG